MRTPRADADYLGPALEAEQRGDPGRVAERAGAEPDERAAVQQDIERVEQAVFAPGAAGLSDGELRDIAGKWLAQLN